MLDLDRVQLDFECPACRFGFRAHFREARLRKIVICRGCKASIQLDDRMNQCRKARRQVAKALQELEETLAKFNKTITLRL